MTNEIYLVVQTGFEDTAICKAFFDKDKAEEVAQKANAFIQDLPNCAYKISQSGFIHCYGDVWAENLLCKIKIPETLRTYITDICRFDPFKVIKLEIE